MKAYHAVMDIHPWDVTPELAIQIQNRLRGEVRIEPLDTDPEWIGGVDASFPRGRGLSRAAVVVLEYRTMRIIDQAVAEIPLSFPYVPGLLSFRESPAILAAIDKLHTLPQVLLCDGHGLAHPRRFGLACHLGLYLDRPTIGCAKSILVGDHASLAEVRGATTSLHIGDEVIGAAVRTRTGVRPVYVSVGHRVDLASAIQVVLNCGRGYRLPEPIRLADRMASEGSRSLG